MNIQERLENATEKAESASQILDEVANGGPGVTVSSRAGPIPSILKWFASLNDRTANAAADLVASAIDDHIDDADPHDQYARSDDLHAVASSGSFNDLDGVPSSFPPSGHEHEAGDVSGLGAMAARDAATAANIRACSGSGGVTAGGLAEASQLVAFSGAEDLTLDWSSFVVGDWQGLDGDRLLENPTNVIPGTTRYLFVSGDSAALREILFDDHFKGADLDLLSDVSSTKWYVLCLIAKTPTHIVVTFADASP